VRENFLKDTKPSRFYEQNQITKGYKHKKPLILKINGFLHLLYGQIIGQWCRHVWYQPGQPWMLYPEWQEPGLP